MASGDFFSNKRKIEYRARKTYQKIFCHVTTITQIAIFCQFMKEKKNILLAVAFVLGIFLAALLTFSGMQHNVRAEENSKTGEETLALNVSPYLPESVDFGGEKIPLDVYWVRENLDRELTIASYHHSTTILSIKRAARFFPTIEKILAEEGIPDDFKYLCVAESNLQNVVSPAKASGFWQFLESTAKIYGLEVNSEVDERYHLEKATRAACRYLKDSKNRLGSWALAAAAYNMGEVGLKRNMETQQCSNYWDLLLNQETGRYMYRIIAYKLIFEHPERYNFSLATTDLYYPIPATEMAIDTTIPDLYQFAVDQNITYRELKELNPWLRTTSLTVKNNKYTISLPVQSKMSSEELLPK